VSGAVLRLVALPEVRVHRQVVSHRVLPLVVVGREVRVPVPVEPNVVNLLEKFVFLGLQM
jgi:hypothetical protein